MFKRVEKKLAKKKNEEELGITEEIKEAIGLNDIDSDDSSSDESEASSSGSSPRTSSKRKRLLDELDASSDADSEGQATDDPEYDEDEPSVQMTVEEALHNPLYIVSIQPDIRGCIVCPRKFLKNDTMASVHTGSRAHRRRISKFKEAAASAKPDDDAQDVLSIALGSTPLRPKSHSAPLSNRAAKRIAKFEKMKTKRQKHKAAKARSIAAKAAKKLETKAGDESKTTDVAQTIEPPKKKPRLERPSSLGKSVKQNPLSTKQKPDGRPDRNSRKPASSAKPQATGPKSSAKSEPAGEKKKRRKVTN